MITKEMKVETDSVMVRAVPAPPPRFSARKTNADSVTKREIAEFWRQKRMVEMDHLLAAIKAAARIRAQNLAEKDYKRFEESLNDDKDPGLSKETNTRGHQNNWWRKSMYAYLNQPTAAMY